LGGNGWTEDYVSQCRGRYVPDPELVQAPILWYVGLLGLDIDIKKVTKG